MAVDVGYFRRWFGNFRATQNRALSAPLTTTRTASSAPLDPRLPDGGGYVIDGLYNLNPDKVGVGDRQRHHPGEELGKQTEHWNGMDLSA